MCWTGDQLVRRLLRSARPGRCGSPSAHFASDGDGKSAALRPIDTDNEYLTRVKTRGERERERKNENTQQLASERNTEIIIMRPHTPTTQIHFQLFAAFFFII